jgi:hypothetical protein
MQLVTTVNVLQCTKQSISDVCQFLPGKKRLSRTVFELLCNTIGCSGYTGQTHLHA